MEVACTDIQRETPCKEIILLKKIDGKTIFFRETQNGKFTRPGGSMSYCSDEMQRLYKIDKFTDMAADAIKLDMTCDDYNLGLSTNPNDRPLYERKYRQVILLKRVSATAA